MIKKRERKKLDNRPSISGFLASKFPAHTVRFRPFPDAPSENVRKSAPASSESTVILGSRFQPRASRIPLTLRCVKAGAYSPPSRSCNVGGVAQPIGHLLRM
jgi:hypothetical protein